MTSDGDGVRQYQESDEDNVVTLLNEVLPDDQPHNNPRNSLRTKMDWDNLMFVAERSGDITGFVMAGYDGHRGWIYQLAVHPDKRSSGTGRQLVMAAENALKALGCLKVNLQVREGNTGVTAFYEKCGYEIENRTSMGRLL